MLAGVSALSSRSEPRWPPGRRPGRVFQPSPQGAASCRPMLMIQSLLPPPRLVFALWGQDASPLMAGVCVNVSQGP